jgi:uncharacterized protein (DUF3820 family)
MVDATPDPAVLLKLTKTRMPFGKYKGRLLIDLPKPYVIWFANKGFPEGELGQSGVLTFQQYGDRSNQRWDNGHVCWSAWGEAECRSGAALCSAVS